MQLTVIALFCRYLFQYFPPWRFFSIRKQYVILNILTSLHFTYEIITSTMQIYIHYHEEDIMTFKISNFQQFVEICIFNSKYKYVSDLCPKSYNIRS